MDNGALETYFKMIDFCKNLLFNSTTEEQEKQARNLLSKAVEDGKQLTV